MYLELYKVTTQEFPPFLPPTRHPSPKNVSCAVYADDRASVYRQPRHEKLRYFSCSPWDLTICVAPLVTTSPVQSCMLLYRRHCGLFSPRGPSEYLHVRSFRSSGEPRRFLIPGTTPARDRSVVSVYHGACGLTLLRSQALAQVSNYFEGGEQDSRKPLQGLSRAKPSASSDWWP